MWTSLGTRPVAALTEFVVSEFHVGQMQVPIVLSFVDDHSQHLGRSVVYPLGISGVLVRLTTYLQKVNQ